MTKKKNVIGFPPIVDKKCKTLILGLIPSNEAIKVNEYYLDPKNQFWKIMTDLFREKDTIGYEQKKEMLLANNIALWDVLCSCKRSEEGPEDDFKDGVYNDFSWFFKQYPKIKKVCCNGQVAYKFFKSNFDHLVKNVDYLPSSSIKNAKTVQWKRNRWRTILKIERRKEKRKVRKY